MSGFYVSKEKNTEPCPYCGSSCEADWTDTGSGWMQIGPFECTHCGSSEIRHITDDFELSEDEKRLGWYAPKPG